MANQGIQGIDCKKKMVILQIISAYGFGLIKGSVVVYATLMNKKLQSRSIPINNSELKFTSNIIWYLDNATLKKFKMASTSIKIEFYHIPVNESSPSEKLGYLIMKLKEAQTIDPLSNDRIESRSYKLIGSKNCNYNLTLSLRIEDFSVKTIETLPEKMKELKLINNKNMNDNDNNFQREDNTHFGENIEINSPKNDVNILEEIDTSQEKNELQQFVTSDDVQQKLVEELDDWKDKQMILFNEKMKIKEEELLKEFKKKWTDERKCIEEELIHEMSKCKVLAENMDKMADMLKEREAIVTARELELACQKDCMDNKYISLVQNLQSSNAQTINELSNKIFELETKLRSSEKANISLRNENELLKREINTGCGSRVQQLENTILSLENKCEEANKSCMFFKEKWITSVRKINQMYTKLHGSKVNEYLYNNKQNIQNVLTNHLIERKQDEEKLKKLLSDLGKLRLDVTNTNYLDT